MLAGRGCEQVEEGTKVAGEVVVGCLVGNVERGEEVAEPGKGWAVEEMEKATGREEGLVQEKKRRGHMRILILSCPCSEYAAASLQEKPSALHELQFNVNHI